MNELHANPRDAMNKLFRISCLLILLLFTFCGCKAQALPSPTVSADADTITATLQQAGLPWTIAAQETLEDARNVYTLHDPDGKKATTPLRIRSLLCLNDPQISCTETERLP